jgi:type IV pilus assembly protein PilO
MWEITEMALLPSDPQTQKKLLAVVAPCLLLLAFWYFYHGPEQEEIGKLETRFEQLERVNGSARARSQQGGADLENKLALYEEQIVQLERLVPRSEEVPELLDALSMRALENGVELARMNPNEQSPGAYYTLHTYDIAVLGGYHDIGRYLAAIGSLPRIVTSYDLRLQPWQQQGRSDEIRLQAEFRIRTYVLPSATLAAS